MAGGMVRSDDSPLDTTAIARDAGFPLAGAVPAPTYAPSAYADQNDRAIARANAIPTGSPAQWIAQLVTNLIPSRTAGAEEPPPAGVPAPQGAVSKLSNAVPAGYVRPPLAPWYERMGLVAPATPAPRPPSIIGDRG